MQRELLANGTEVYINETHRFGSDALLLAAFCNIKRAEAACELGTGCGVIPLRWHDRGHRGPCAAVELDGDALALLRASLAQQNIAHIEPVCADLRAWRPDKLFDLVCCNPPYFTGGRKSRSEARAKARHELTCTVADVCAAAAALLRGGGRLCMCQRPERLADVIAAMRAACIEPKRLQFVAARAGKEPFLFLIEGQKNRAPGVRVLTELLMQREQGGPSEAVLAIYGKQPKEDAL